ncbi:LOW QUALITY PROTEIN: p450 domain-containing protein, partial [Cephalotus follicularis]
AVMDFFFKVPTIAMASLFAFVIFVWYLLWLSRGFHDNKSKKKAPPEAGGRWPVIGHLHLLRGPQPAHIVLGDMADKYGPIYTIKLGVHRNLVVSSWEMAKECLTINDKLFANRPKTLAMEILGYNFSMLGFSPYGHYWRRVRKIVTLQLLSNHRLEMLKHVRESVVKVSLKELYQSWVNKKDISNKALVEMRRWFNTTTINVIVSILVGKLPDQDSGGWIQTVTKFFELAGTFVVADALPILRKLDIGGHERAMKQTAKELDHVAQGWLEDHKRRVSCAVNAGGEDFMDAMLTILDEEEDFSNHDAYTINKSTCLALMAAASESTSVTLTWCLSLLLNNRHVLKKAQDEIDTHVGKERQLKESDINNLTYLHAIIKETMRLYPAAPLSAPHESMEDCTVSGYHVPVGTRLLVNLWKIQRDPRVWTDPCKFQPERFLTTHKNIDVRGQNFELIPFGAGRRMCPGISFALQVLQLSLASLFHGFEITTLSYEPVDMTERVGLTSLKATPFEVLLTPRLPTYLY